MADQFIPAIKKIVGPHLLVPASLELDRNEVTDLIVLTARDLRIAARVRRHTYLPKYAGQFTIRTRPPRSGECELNKILNEFGDWMFYGFVTEDETSFSKWWILDLSSFRRHYRDRASNGLMIHHLEEFDSFEIASFPANPPLVLHGSDSTIS
jgi:hypothetical protein